MGISAGLAVVFSALAFLAQSPNLLVRFRMAGSRVSQGGRRLTGLGLACTLLGAGFFMAGVPIGEPAATANIENAVTAAQPANSQAVATLPQPQSDEPVDQVGLIEPESEAVAAAQTGAMGSQAEQPEEAADPTTVSGAFSQPAPSEEEDTETETDTTESNESEPAPTAAKSATEAADTPTPTPTDEPTPTNTPQPTSTPTPLPTATPTPTITPTAVNVETISADFVGSVTWVYRVPGNNQLALINNGDPLLLEPGRAMINGVTWQEVRLLDGRLGWIQLSLIDLGEE